MRLFSNISFLTCRAKVPSMNEDAFHLIISFLDSELKVEALLTLHELVRHLSSPRSHVMASVVTPPLFKILASEDTEGLEQWRSNNRGHHMRPWTAQVPNQLM